MASLFAFGRAQLASVYRRNGAGRHARWWGGAVKAALPVTEGSLSAVIEHEIIPAWSRRGRDGPCSRLLARPARR